LDKLKKHKQLNKKDQHAQRFSYMVSFIADKILIFASYHPYFYIRHSLMAIPTKLEK